MAKTFTGRERVRMSFGQTQEVAPMPNLIEVQKKSYDHFLQAETAPDGRGDWGLEEVFKSVFPITDFSGKSMLEYVSYEFEEPKFDVEECQQRGMTYAAPLKVTLRLVVWDVDEETDARSIRDIKEQDVYMGDMPMMTKHGTFVVNGTERVIVSQMHRSPGVFFDHDRGKTHSSGKFLFSARVIPYRGSWLDFEFDAKDVVFVRIDRRRKLPVTTFLMALDNAETSEKRAKAAAKGETLDPLEAEGLSPQDILNFFYENIEFKRSKLGWKTKFDPERMRGQVLVADMVDAKTGEVVAEAETKITARTGRKLAEDGLKERIAPDEELLGQYIASDIVDPKTGAIYAEAGEEITEENLEKINESGVDTLPLLAIDHVNVGPYMRNTLAADKNMNREEALIDIYRVMRPGEPPTVEAAEALLNSMFFDAERYDLSAVGRVKMNARLGFEDGDVPDTIRVLRREDIIAIVKHAGRTQGRPGRDRRYRPSRQPPGPLGRRADGEPVPGRPAAHGARHQGAHVDSRDRHASCRTI